MAVIFATALFCVVFALSGIGKLIDPDPAANALVMVFGIPYPLAVFAIFLVSNGELLLACALVFKRFRTIVLKYFIPAFLLMFLIFLLYIHFTGLILDDCGCFGGLWKRTIPEAIIEEIILCMLWTVYYVISIYNRRHSHIRF